MAFQRDIQKNATEVIRVEVSEYKGEKYFNVRIWYQDKNGEYKPTQKGVAIRSTSFAEFKNYVLEAEQELLATDIQHEQQ